MNSNEVIQLSFSIDEIGIALLVISMLLVAFNVFIITCNPKSNIKSHKHILLSKRNSKFYYDNVRLKLHIKYIIVIALAIIVLLLACILFHDANFGAQLSLASTISSIILSVLAIIMSILGESKSEILRNQMEKSSDKIINATDKVNEQFNVLIETVKITLEDVKNTENNVKDVLSKTEQISQKMEKIESVMIATKKENLNTSDNSDWGEI